MARTRWEYLTVEITEGFDGDTSIVGWKTEHEVDTLNDLLDDIGSFGWELVGFQWNGYIFKRELID